MAKRRAGWDGQRVRALRQHLGLTQEQLAQEMGARQQTISEWETGLYQPRGLSERLLSLVAERAGFAYDASAPVLEAEPPAGSLRGVPPEPFSSSSPPAPDRKPSPDDDEPSHD